MPLPPGRLEGNFRYFSEYDLKLNPTKCTFKVKFGKFLGFMTLKCGIKVNLHKIEAVLKLAKPHYIKDIQRMNRCIAALRRFVSKFVERCMSFFKALTKYKLKLNPMKCTFRVHSGKFLEYMMTERGIKANP